MKAILADALYVPKAWVDERLGLLMAFTYRFEQKIDFGFGYDPEAPVVSELVKMYREVGEYYAFSRGDLVKLEKIFHEFEFDDRRSHCPFDFTLEFTGKLKEDQKKGLKAFIDPNIGGIFQAPPAYGKTVVMVAYATLQQQQMLLLVNKVDLKDQFVQRLRTYSNINELEEKLGRKLVGELKFDKKGEPIYYPITVSTYQLINHNMMERLKKIQNLFGIVMVDECHRAPAASLLKIISYMNPRHFMGVSATPKRKDNFHLLLPDLLGPVRYASSVKNNCQIVIQKGIHLELPPNMDWTRVIAILTKNIGRTNKIVDKVIEDLKEHRRVMILSDRVLHVEQMAAVLKERGVLAAAITGPMKVADRDVLIDKLMGLEKAIDLVFQEVGVEEKDWEAVKTWPDLFERLDNLKVSKEFLSKIRNIYANRLDCIVGTKQLFSEGTDIPCIDTLHLTCPTANEVFIEQAIGRVQRFYLRKQFPRTTYWADSGCGILYGCSNKFRNYCSQTLKYEVQDQTKTKSIEDLSRDIL